MSDPVFFLYDGAAHELREGTELPEGAQVVPRLPTAGERWVDGRGWVLDRALLADLNASQAHVERARNHKLVEAELIKSGVQLQRGLLVNEAGQRGLTLDAMADMVLAASADFTETERIRMAAKIASPPRPANGK